MGRCTAEVPRVTERAAMFEPPHAVQLQALCSQLVMILPTHQLSISYNESNKSNKLRAQNSRL
jgi:hypothetical protein